LALIASIAKRKQREAFDTSPTSAAAAAATTAAAAAAVDASAPEADTVERAKSPFKCIPLKDGTAPVRGNP
jgi:hypothetical protein